MMKRLILSGFAIVCAIVAYAVIPGDVPELARRTVAIFVLAAILWASEAIPLYATSLCVVGLEVLLLAEHGGLARHGDLRSEQFLSPFASGVIILFMGGFLLAKAMTKHGLDAIIARKLLHPFARAPLRLLYGILGITAFFSMWMSNTATAAMMLAVVAPMLRQAPPHTRMGTAMMLAVPFGANIGGLGTPIGTPPNAICLASLRTHGWDIGFVQWMSAAVPLVILLIIVAGWVIYGVLRPERDIVLAGVEESAEPITWQGWIVIAILLLAIALWLTSPWHGIRESVVALIAAALLTACGVLDRADVDSIDWNVLLLMWGGLALSNAMELTQLTAWIGALPFVSLTGLWLPVTFVMLAMGLSTFMSNTAAANLLMPIAMIASGTDPLQLTVLTAFACSFAMALPISTPPNALAFASGRIAARHMFLTGGVMSILGTVLLLAGFQLMLPLVF